MSNEVKQQAQRGGEAIRSGLDVMLTDAVAGPPRFFAPGPAVRVATGLARRPRGVVRRAAGLTTELARAATGRSQLAPPGGDRRFAANPAGTNQTRRATRLPQRSLVPVTAAHEPRRRGWGCTMSQEETPK